MDLLKSIKTLIFINESPSAEDEALLTVLIDLVTFKVMAKIKRHLPETREIPDSLNFAVVEAVVSRYNRIGSEGMTTEVVEGHTMTFNTKDKAMEDLMAEVDNWIDDNLEDPGRKKVVRFL